MVTIKDIANTAGTSLSTVSRVLNGIAIRDKTLAEKIHKIAEQMNYQPNEAGRNLRMGSDDDFGPVLEIRSRQDVNVKRLIAAEAAKMVTARDVVVLDSGSTVAQMAFHLPADVLVYTNSLAVVQPAAKRGVHVHLAPGLYVPAMGAVFGQETEDYFRRHKSSIYFLSSARVDVRTGLFNLNATTYNVKRVALEHASRKVLMVHHEKFCDAGLDTFAPLSSVDMIITDFVPDIFRDPVSQSGVEVIEIGGQQ
ncbi:DeoR/GlpR family DNA-binding transcription regulator [Alicyclobacillus dauci]|uniref:LacI family DNA-binding transcriptional regulator n=1 Tax=Alicyclobacillus dauci TaxID=1475485 RepID=A0ABY6Z946_9BACL|nr:LacI family DNA-binding transcriptional regulator [Alicyclobacillus dauci]WAH36250.1 LacI family DNA-binding transcriptional regulator [Alicyclobacillus dauci]WAH39428.1 LacI family DNA-binding transcriptional regulator [Alicyclobacillus dauci]